MGKSTKEVQKLRHFCHWKERCIVKNTRNFKQLAEVLLQKFQVDSPSKNY